MKKLLAILLAAVMLLSSCGVSERNPTEQGGSSDLYSANTHIL